jgi:Niemann-Pick C1 protein
LTWIAYASWGAVFWNVLVIAMTIVDVIGFMYYWTIDLNAISILYLVWAVGLGLECCGHVTLKYLYFEGSKQKRVNESLTDVGSHFYNAVVTTLLGHILVLLFAGKKDLKKQSLISPAQIAYPLFKIYYGRMYVVIILLGLLHGLVLLPVLLSLAGPKETTQKEEEEYELK